MNQKRSGEKHINFVYGPLAWSGQFWILTILAAGDDHLPLRCRLRQATHDYSPKYEALPYAWGSMPNRSIIINKKALKYLRRAIDLFLSLRRRDAQRLVWVDAIYINQLDAEEKAHQVEQMSKIHRHAEKVTILLGGFRELHRPWSILCGVGGCYCSP